MEEDPARDSARVRLRRTRVTGVGEYDPAYRRDGLCFLLLVLAVLFCASEWFRVSGPFGQLLHAIAAVCLV